MSQQASRFGVGDLILHRRFRYRGVVAALSRENTSRESTPSGARTPVDPHNVQAWYHVLVHGTQETAYVAEENLEADHGGEQVIHPRARELFEYFHRNRYLPRENVAFTEAEHGC